MQRFSEMNVSVEERELFRRPGQTTVEPCNKVYPALRRIASHAVYPRRKGRPIVDVREQGLVKSNVLQMRRKYAKHILTSTSYPIIGNNKVEAVYYTEPGQSVDKGLVWINQKQYFKDVPPEVWNFSLGNCQICQKWLKDREGRALTTKDVQHYQRIVMALKEMIDLMAGIDAAIKHEKFSEKKVPTAIHH